MYKQASKFKLRFTTKYGELNVEQLWDLPFKELTTIIKDVRKELKTDDEDNELSFLNNPTKANVKNQLRFDILKDVYLTMKKEQEDLLNKHEIKKHNEKIDALIAEKKDGQLRDMSIEELEKLRK
jgi:hypothetical protein